MIWFNFVKDYNLKKINWWKKMKDLSMTKNKVVDLLIGWEEVLMQQQFL